MCPGSRMAVRQGGGPATVVACTLLPCGPEFKLGATLAEATLPVRLNHRFYEEFFVLGGASCSGSGVARGGGAAWISERTG